MHPEENTAAMKIASLKEVKDHLSEYVSRTEDGDIVITRNGKPAAVLHHLAEDDLEEYLIEHDPRFKKKIEARWASFVRGEGGIPMPRPRKRRKA